MEFDGHSSTFQTIWILHVLVLSDHHASFGNQVVQAATFLTEDPAGVDDRKDTAELIDGERHPNPQHDPFHESWDFSVVDPHNPNTEDFFSQRLTTVADQHP